jgi:hypothetical protein
MQNGAPEKFNSLIFWLLALVLTGAALGRVLLSLNGTFFPSTKRKPHPIS